MRMSSSINHIMAKIDNTLSRSGNFSKRSRETKNDYQSPFNGTTSYIQSIYHSNSNNSQNKSEIHITHTETDADIRYSLLKKELIASQDKFKSEIKEILQLVISNKEITDKAIDSKLESFNKDINDLKDHIIELEREKKELLNQLIAINKDKNDHYDINTTTLNNRADDREKQEEINSQFMNTCRSHVSIFTEEIEHEMKYRINKNNQNIKALNQNIKTIIGHLKQNSFAMKEIKTVLNQMTINITKINEENNIKFIDIGNIKDQYDTLTQALSSQLDYSKKELANGLETLGSFHNEQNKFNEIYAKAIQELYNVFNKEKIENEKNNQIVENNFNMINPLLNKIKSMPDLEQDIPLLAEFRKSMMENRLFCWSRLNKNEDLSQSHENIDTNINSNTMTNKGVGKERINAEMTQTDFYTRNTCIDDSVVIASPIIHHHYQSTSVVEDLYTNIKEKGKCALNIKYYLSGYITNDNCNKDSDNLNVQNCNSLIENQSEEFNLDKSSGKMKNRKIMSIKNTIAILDNRTISNTTSNNEPEKINRKKKIVDMIKKEMIVKKYRIIEIKEDDIN